MASRDRRIGQRVFPVLLLFIFLFLFQPSPLHPQDSQLDDIMKGEMDAFDPFIYHDEIRHEIDDVR